jgi:hypothetical protein
MPRQTPQHYKQDVFMHRYSLVHCFMYHLIYYRTLRKGYTKRGLRNRFWHMTIDAHLNAATISWCMVFGSDGCNPTHWKRLFKGQSEELMQSFREGLFKELHLSKAAWDKYWDSIKDFRDKFVAHIASSIFLGRYQILIEPSTSRTIMTSE